MGPSMEQPIAREQGWPFPYVVYDGAHHATFMSKELCPHMCVLHCVCTGLSAEVLCVGMCAGGRPHAPPPLSWPTAPTISNLPYLPNHFTVLGSGTCAGCLFFFTCLQ